MVVAAIGVGSNFQTPERQVCNALEALERLEKTRVLQRSSLYRSRPLGPQDQPYFINAAVTLETGLTPEALLVALQGVEQRQGRVRTGLHWGPRVIDLDILLYGNLSLATAALTIPHPGLSEREFVLYPLAEIAPGLILPSGESILSLQRVCPRRGLERLKSEVRA